MSVATEFPPSVHIPARARTSAASAPRLLVAVDGQGRACHAASGATSLVLPAITVLRPPSGAAVAAPVRLTRRGVVVLALAVALVGAAMVWLAWLSAPAARGAGAPAGPAVVTVTPGDTLWSIATRAAPDRDPRDEVTVLMQLNHLRAVDLAPGQILRVR